MWARHARGHAVHAALVCWASGGLDTLLARAVHCACCEWGCAGIAVKRGGCAMQCVRTLPAPLTMLPLIDA